jgi:hypothetical protein
MRPIGLAAQYSGGSFCVGGGQSQAGWEALEPSLESEPGAASSAGERLLHTQEVAGSKPAPPTIRAGHGPPQPRRGAGGPPSRAGRRDVPSSYDYSLRASARSGSAPSSSGPGRSPLKAEIAGSNPAGATRTFRLLDVAHRAWPKYISSQIASSLNSSRRSPCRYRSTRI